MSYPREFTFVTLTHPKPSLWVIEMHNGQDNRLTPELVNNGLKPALDAVEKHWREIWRVAREQEEGRGAVIIVGRQDQDKFFSNGLDLDHVVQDPGFMPYTFNPLLARLLTFPLPIIAAINGHCFAGGMMLSLACDYRVMTDGTKRRAWMCMNEVHFGGAWPLSFTAILRAKVGHHQLQRKIALEGHRFTPQEALADGLLDHLVEGGTKEVLAKAEEIADSVCANSRSGVLGLIKRDLYRDTLEYIGLDLRVITPYAEDEVAKARL